MFANTTGYTPPQLLKPGVAIVTGASSGIGRQTAVALAVAGWTCVLSGRDGAELRKTEEMIKEATKDQQVKTLCIQGDLTEDGAVERLFSEASQQFQRIDLLFNNAGISQPSGPIEDLDLARFQKLLDINVRVPFHCTQLAFRYMKAQTPQGGRIINNGSISAYAPRPNSAPYTLSKHAISGLTKSSALDGRPFNIACCQLDIGNALSALSAKPSGHPQADGSIKHEDMMDIVYAAHAVVQMASLPLHVNTLTQTIMATNMPFVGRG